MCIYCGLDPSFKHFGISYIDENKKEITFTERQYEIFKKSFKNKFEVTYVMVQEIVAYIKSLSKKENIYLGQEVSTAYTGYFVAELYGLGCMLYNDFCVSGFRKYTIHSQSYITFILGRNIPKGQKKEATIFYVEDQLLPIFEKHGYKINKEHTAKTNTGEKNGRLNIKRETITDGCADAFLYSVYNFVKHTSDENLKKDILELNNKFREEKELD